MHTHSLQLLQKEFFLKPSYMSFLEAVCSVSDGHAVPHQQIRVFELFVKKHKNLLFQLRLAPRKSSDVEIIKKLSYDNFFYNLTPSTVGCVEGPKMVNCVLGVLEC